MAGDLLKLLHPTPQRVEAKLGHFELRGRWAVAGDGVPPDLLHATLERLRRELASLDFEVAQVDGPEPGALVLHWESTAESRPGAYRLHVGEKDMALTAGEADGLRHGVTTLLQWLQIQRHHSPGTRHLPCLEIEDFPDFTHRGVMLDISRNKVPQQGTLHGLVDLLAGFKVNQLQLYTEHTFAYDGHGTVWRDASPMTPDEIRQLEAHCLARGIELVPNQNSFGHFHRWLIHEPYRRLAEVPEGLEHPFSDQPEPFSLCPIDPGSLDLLTDLYDQLLPNFQSSLFNVGLDETLDLGLGRSAEACEQHGKGRVYLDFLHQVHRLVSDRGRRMMFWGDVILKHPELIPELPADAIALEWGYHADHPFAEDGRHFADSGLEYWVCPGTSAWNSFGGRVENAQLNLANAAVSGRQGGAKGYLITDWGDHGHLQPLPVSYPGLLAGAGFAWNASKENTRFPVTIPLAELLDTHVFHDRSGQLGRSVVDLGNVYRLTGAPPPGAKDINGSALFFQWMFAHKPVDLRRGQGMTRQHLRQTLGTLEGVRDRLRRARPTAPDAGLVTSELVWVAEILHLCARLADARLELGQKTPADTAMDLSPRYLRQALRQDMRREIEVLTRQRRELWMARHRPGGWNGSEAKLQRLFDLLH